MTLAGVLRFTNRNMIAFDLALGTAAIAAPAATLKALGHDEPAPEARELFRRCGPVWLTFAAAHAVAERRGSSADWQSLAWLRGTEIATDALWSRSPGINLRGKAGLWFAGAANVAMTAGFAWMSRNGSGRR
jgi:hypothetical protein